MLYRLLEINDSLAVMVSNSLINTSFSLVRNVFETLVHLRFIFNNNENVKQKAMTYHYCDLRRRCPNEEKENFNKQMSTSKHFSSIHKEAINTPKSDKLSWYGVYRKKRTTFKELCQEVDLEVYYLALYPHLSSDIHGNSCLEINTVCFEEGGKYYLRNFRSFERHHSLMVLQIDFMRKVFLSFKEHFEIPEALTHKINNFNNRASEYIEAYWSIKDSFLDPTPDFLI